MEHLDWAPLKFKEEACFVKKVYSRGTIKAGNVKPSSEGSAGSENLLEQAKSGEEKSEPKDLDKMIEDFWRRNLTKYVN